MALGKSATCIGCECTDDQACVNDATGNPCHWLAVDYEAHLGVCSECADSLERWHEGDRRILAPVFVAKITREGDSEAYYLEPINTGWFETHRLKLEAGDRFCVEMVEMSVDDFSKRPQFEFQRLFDRWLEHMLCAEREVSRGDEAAARNYRMNASLIAATLASHNYDVNEMLEEQENETA